MAPSVLDKETLDQVIAFHGHLCPGLVTGVRAAEIALRELGPRAADEELVAIVESLSCAVDAIQFLTGCTLGKGNLIHRDYGKAAFTFARRSDARAVRIVARAREAALTAEQEQLVHRVRTGQASEADRRAYDSLWRERSLQVLDEDEDSLFDVQTLDCFRLPEAAHTDASVRCEGCGEMVMSTRASSLEGRTLCPSCYRKAGGHRITMRPVAVIHNELRPGEAPPRVKSERSLIVVYPEFADALRHIEEAEELDVLFYLSHAPAQPPLLQHRRGDSSEPLRGVFALRSPHRPNPIGLTTVRFLSARGNELVVSGLDAWDGTPVLDIKPHV